MTETKHKKNRTWTDGEKETHKEQYGTQILVENGTMDECSTRNAPTDASIVHYIHNDRDCYDLTRGSKITLFDMYWDKMKDNLKSINYGNGFIKPNLWGYQSPTTKKKKRK